MRTRKFSAFPFIQQPINKVNFVDKTCPVKLEKIIDIHRAVTINSNKQCKNSRMTYKNTPTLSNPEKSLNDQRRQTWSSRCEVFLMYCEIKRKSKMAGDIFLSTVHFGRCLFWGQKEHCMFVFERHFDRKDLKYIALQREETSNRNKRSWGHCLP